MCVVNKHSRDLWLPTTKGYMAAESFDLEELVHVEQTYYPLFTPSHAHPLADSTILDTPTDSRTVASMASSTAVPSGASKALKSGKKSGSIKALQRRGRRS